MCADSVLRSLDRNDLCYVDQCSVTYLNALYASGDFLFQDSTWRWTYVPGSSVNYWVRLDSGSDELWLGIATMLQHNDIDFDWREYEGDVQRVAWAASYSALLEIAQQLFQRDWIPGSISMGEAPANSTVDAGFDITLSSAAFAVGRCRFRPQLLSPTRRNLRCEVSPATEHLPISLRVVVDTAWLCIDELQKLEIGAVFHIRRRAFLDFGARATLQVGDLEVLTKVADLKLVVVNVSGAATRNIYQKEKLVDAEETITEDSSDGCDPVLEPIKVDDLPVQVQFEAGRIATSFSELRTLKPGFVFELGHPLSEQTINIRANGALIGRGELVAIGDQLGVRVTALCGKLQAI